MEENFDKDDLLGRWLGGSLSEAEERALKARADFAEYERLANTAKELPRPTYDTQGALAQLKARRAKGSGTGAAAGAREGNGAKVRRLRPAHWLGIAAAVLLLITTVFLLQSGADLELTAAAGTMEQAELPDGSSIKLNAVTSFAFTGSEAARSAELDGEAFFEIKKDGRPFTVSTSRGKVRVLGTSFNVYSRDGVMRVSCTTGKVSVKFNSDKAADGTNLHTLTPGKSVSIDADGNVSEADIPTTESLDWLNGRSLFNHRPLSEVIAELERQYDLDIKPFPNQDLEQIIKTGFPHDSLDLALEIALDPLENMKFQREGRTVVLTPK